MRAATGKATIPGNGDNPQFWAISPMCVFKSPLGHKYRCDFPKIAST
jgi:hypothetical protein